MVVHPGPFLLHGLSQLGDVPRPGGTTNGAGKALIQQLKSAIPCPVGLGPMHVELTHQEICTLSQWMPRSTADLTERLLRYSSNEMPFITSSRELQASRTSCKYADLSRAIDWFFCSINCASKNLVLHRPLHHQVNVGLENSPTKCLASDKKDKEALGDFQWTKLNQKVNIAFSRYEVLS